MKVPNSNFGDLIAGLLLAGFCIGIGIWGATEFFFASNTIRVAEPLKPTLEITIKDNVIDTIYIYEKVSKH